MKKLLYIFLLSGCMLNAQNQLTNAGFEKWEGTGEMEEPVGWNALMTASGSGMAYKMGRPKLIEASSDIREGAEGTKSLKMHSKEVMGTIIVGSISTGQFNVENIKPEHPSNHAVTRTDNSSFHQKFTGKPKAVSFWAKFITPDKQYKGCAGFAIHDHSDFNSNDFYTQSEKNHVIARAFTENIDSNVWKQYTIPFVYTGSNQAPAFIHVIFSTNPYSGHGTSQDVLYIDDIEFIY